MSPTYRLHSEDDADRYIASFSDNTPLLVKHGVMAAKVAMWFLPAADTLILVTVVTHRVSTVHSPQKTCFLSVDATYPYMFRSKLCGVSSPSSSGTSNNNSSGGWSKDKVFVWIGTLCVVRPIVHHTQFIMTFPCIFPQKY